MHEKSNARNRALLLRMVENASVRGSLFHSIFAFVCAATLFLSTDNVIARGRGSYGRIAAAAAKAQRARLISSVQQQVVNAQQILQKAESQSQMTQAELNAANTKLSGIREDIGNTQHDVVEAAKTLRDIEAELIAQQTPDSEYGKALATADEVKNDVHLTIHRVLNLPMQELKPGLDPRKEDLKQLTITQMSTLQDNQSYIDSDMSLKDAIQKVSHFRQKLFQDDSEWVAAHEDLVNANHDKRDGEKERRMTGSSAAGKRQELQNVNNVVQTARSIIAQGEYRLRQLGASVPQAKPTASSPTPRKK